MRVLGEERDDKNTEPCWRYGCNKTNLSVVGEREGGKTMEVVEQQLSPVVKTLRLEDYERLVVAYEPVWAIGTGKVATPDQAEEVHAFIRAWIAKKVGSEVAQKLRIIYGGSVKASNCQTLIKCQNIDGFLVGGASLQPEFADIIKCTPGMVF